MNPTRYADYMRPMLAAGLGADEISKRLRMKLHIVERTIRLIEGIPMNDEPEIERQARNAELCEAAMRLWRSGFDTVDIARLTGSTEPVICRILRVWRELGRDHARLYEHAKAGEIGARG